MGPMIKSSPLSPGDPAASASVLLAKMFVLSAKTFVLSLKTFVLSLNMFVLSPKALLLLELRTRQRIQKAKILGNAPAAEYATPRRGEYAPLRRGEYASLRR